MLKPVSMLLAFALCSLLGVQRAARLQRRVKLLSALQNDVKRLMIRMEFEKKPLAVIVSDRARGELQRLWAAFAEELLHGRDTRTAFLAALDTADAEIAGFSSLGTEERAMLTEFAAALGSTELDGQRQNTAMLLAGLEPLFEQASDECGTKGRIYRTVGMLSGAAAVILML